MSSRRLRIPEDVIYRDVAGEAVILNLETGVYFGLDPVGSRIWSLIGELRDSDKVLEALLAEYDVEEKQLRADLDELVGQLLTNALLKEDDEDHADGTSR